MPRKTIIRSRAAASSIMPDDASRISTCDSAVVMPARIVVVHAQRDRADRPEQEDDVDRSSGSCRPRSGPGRPSYRVASTADDDES